MCYLGELIYQHPDFILINKPAGVSVHKDQTSTSWVSAWEQRLQEPHLYLVHRLDKMTSGLILLARHANAAAALSELFAQRQVHKYYLALVGNKPKKKQGLICGDMQKGRGGNWKLLPTRQRPAITQFFSIGLGLGMRACLLKPYTGYTHQLRVALKSLGAPILGDPRYAPAHLSADRGYLHAYSLQFFYQGRAYAFYLAPKEGDLFHQAHMQACLAHWRRPEQLAWPDISPLVKR
ncbi:tRNA pseudouridine32 synthase / 23S rRNA pseudouridine746 synthase [Allopseudospirillum japonicum]|uniref:tRNA pseudouridine32 synthase / 23S rRNA pseudouridine746 synthase n=1 Tax=Allopseudospirillum japonicum TaxID=64971 RepID=A0A1H6T6T8_9GAMM|nr:TIGR01621 family pseudouridine synthase [Allopseudospirillum japonicum]SEI75803.1 tRNA pseudouridine32 synthase / 23S rRNA pseudouridine746 synthase [Allopseudospirillum japonicum]